MTDKEKIMTVAFNAYIKLKKQYPNRDVKFLCREVKENYYPFKDATQKKLQLWSQIVRNMKNDLLKVKSINDKKAF